MCIRDRKPENVFVTHEGRVKLLDFGLAKRTGPGSGSGSGLLTAEKHTDPGTVMGTVRYMSPEQVRGEPVDHRSDIFSFGVVLYEICLLYTSDAADDLTRVDLGGRRIIKKKKKKKKITHKSIKT